MRGLIVTMIGMTIIGIGIYDMLIYGYNYNYIRASKANVACLNYFGYCLIWPWIFAILGAVMLFYFFLGYRFITNKGARI